MKLTLKDLVEKKEKAKEKRIQKLNEIQEEKNQIIKEHYFLFLMFVLVCFAGEVSYALYGMLYKIGELGLYFAGSISGGLWGAVVYIFFFLNPAKRPNIISLSPHRRKWIYFFGIVFIVSLGILIFMMCPPIFEQNN